MNKEVRKITKEQLAEMITNITKRVLAESLEFGEGANVPETTPTQMPTDINEEDNWFSPEEAIVNEEQNQEEAEDLNESAIEDEKEMIEKQEKLLNFITESWNNHANNLIK